MHGPELSVVIPAYNEEGRLPATLDRVIGYLRERGMGFEVIVVDDGSSDATARIVRDRMAGEPRLRYLGNGRNRGKGYSVRNGVLGASGGLVLFTDADLSTPIEELPRLMAALDEGAEVAIGSRGLRDSVLAVRQPWYRELMGRTFNLLVQLVLVRGIYDTQCGFKLMRGAVGRDVFSRLTIDGFGFDVEMVYVAHGLRYRIAEVPVRWVNSPLSKVNVLRDSARMFVDVLRTRVNWMRGVYGGPGAGRKV